MHLCMLISNLSENAKYHLPIGGVERQAVKLLAVYEKQTDKLTVITKYSNIKNYLPKTSIIQFLDSKNSVESIIIRHLFYYRKSVIYSILFSMSCALRLVNIHRKARIDVLNVQGLDFLTFPAVFMSKLLGIKNFFKLTEAPRKGVIAFLDSTNNGMLNHLLYSCASKLLPSLIHSADNIQALNTDIKSILERIFSFPGNRIFTVPNGVEPDKLKNLYNPTRNTVGFVGRLYPVKNVPIIIEGFHKFVKHHPNYQLAIFGEGKERARLESLVTRLGLDNKVIFHGFQSNLQEIYSSFNIFINASFSEGISNSILEAMAAGIPVIASDVIGNRDIIINGEDGLLFDPHNSQELSDKMTMLAENEDYRDALRNKALLKIRNEYDINIIVKKIIHSLKYNVINASSR